MSSPRSIDPRGFDRSIDRSRAILGALAVFALCLWGVPRAAERQPEVGNTPPAAGPGVRVEYDLKVPMRDGVRLSTDIYRPAAEGRYPVIVIRSPYGNQAEGNARDGFFLAEHGYAVVIQDVRGREDSEGEWLPFIHEADDGYDTIGWAAAQPWSTGRVGTYGGSYLAQVQWRAATAAPPHLVAMFPVVAYSDFFHNWVYTGGAFQLGFNLRWMGIQMHTRTRQSQYLWFEPPHHLSSLYRHLPLVSVGEVSGRTSPVYEEWIRHPTYDSYWKDLSIEQYYDRITVPAYGVAGWFDVFLQGTINNYAGVRKSGATHAVRMGQKLLIGPWIHTAAGRRIGDVDFGPAADLNRMPITLRWFDYWLKGIDNGILDEPPVTIFVMGENVWRQESEWPLARARYTPYYLHSEGRANSLFGDGALTPGEPGEEPPDRYTYDPSDPVPTLGGSTCCFEEQTPIPMGPRDQRPVERRDDVLVYTSAPLEAPLEVTGPVKVHVFASSSAHDTDFTAKLVDVLPNGFAMNVAEGILRARFRDSWESPSLLDPGRPYEFVIDLWSTSNVFQPGHRIRVEISSSNFPHFDRNPNTGRPFGMDADLEVANQTVYHDRTRPSRIILPVIPRSASDSAQVTRP